RHDLEQFVERAKPARQGDVRRAMHEKRSFSRIKVIEIEAMCLVAVILCLAWQLDVQADTVAARFESAFVGRFHDAWPAAGYNGQSSLGQAGTQCLADCIIG